MRAAAAVVLLALAVPFVVLLVRARLTLDVSSAGDVGLTELAVRHVGSAATPLVGPYSRFHWHHPGPALFYALAGPYRLLGSDGSSLLAGAVLLNLLAVLGVAVLLWRRGRLMGLLAGSLVVLILAHALGDVLFSPWNPWLVPLPMLFFVVAVWSVWCGDLWVLPFVVGVGTALVQTHVGTVPVVVVGTVLAVIAAVRARRRAVRWRRLVTVSTAIAVVPWLPPLLDAARHDGGNLRALVRYWSTAHTATVGWTRAGRIVAEQLAVPAPWSGGHEAHAAFTASIAPSWHVPWVAVLVVGAVLVARRRGDAPAVALGVGALVLALTAWIATAQIRGEPFDYLVRWTWLVGACSWLAIVWTAVGWFRDTTPRLRLAVTIVTGAVVVAMSVVVTVDASRARTTFRTDEHALQALEGRLVQTARSLPEPVLVENTPDLRSGGLAFSVLTRLDQAGIDARLGTEDAWIVGDGEVVARSAAGSRLIASFGDGVGRLERDPRYRVIASFDMLTPAERADLDRISRRIPSIDRVAAWGRTHPRLWRRYQDLADRADRGAIFLARRSA